MAVDPVPDTLVRRVRAIFPPSLTESKRVVRIMAELIFDSRIAPAAAGLRSTWNVGWQAIYRAGDCSLDLRIEPELNTSRAAVIGQISNHENPDHKISNVPVQLKAGRSVVAETRSNQFGEFQLEYEQQTRLRLCVYLDEGSRCIEVPLKRFVPEKPGATDRLNLGTIIRKRPASGRP